MIDEAAKERADAINRLAVAIESERVRSKLTEGAKVAQQPTQGGR